MILFLKSSNSSFLETDEKIFCSNFRTTVIDYCEKSFVKKVLKIFRYILFQYKKFSKFKIIAIHFCSIDAAFFALLSKVFKIKLMVFIGGMDVVYIPEYNYGFYRSWRKPFIKFALNNAHFLLPKHKSLIYNKNLLSDKVRYEGIRSIAPKTRATIRTIPNGYDANFWKKEENYQKEKCILCVAYINSLRTFYLKGIDFYIQAAGKFPETTFYLIGDNIGIEQILSIPKNLILLPSKKPNEILSYYSRSKVFCLLTHTEGMPNVLCEAMLCECIPVATNTNAIPDIINDSELIINKLCIDEICRKINYALNLPVKEGGRFRTQILNNFSYQNREQQLVELIKQVI